MDDFQYASIALTPAEVRSFNTDDASGVQRLVTLAAMMADAPGVKTCRLHEDHRSFNLYFQVLVQYGNTGIIMEALKPWFGEVSFSAYVPMVELGHQRMKRELTQ